jgi:DNA-binding NtrC family response regulator
MLIDDEENILSALKRVLRNKEWEIETYSNPVDALKRLQTSGFDLIISDYRMPEMDGVKFLTQAKEIHLDSIRIILSGYTDLESLMDGINKAEIYRFLCKPWQDYDLLTTINKALEHRDMLLENKMLANQVRQQKQELEKRKTALEVLQQQHPSLLEVNWSDDGSIILDESPM